METPGIARAFSFSDINTLSVKSCIVLNPAAGRGRAAKIRENIFRNFAAVGITQVFETSQFGDEERATLQAIDLGFDKIVVAGGDGTCSKVANTVLKGCNQISICVVPCGTGNDFAKTLGIADYAPEQIANLVASVKPTAIDVGFVDGKYFLNSCGFGFDASVLDASNRVRFLQGDAVYIYAALRQLFSYRGIDVAVSGASGVLRGPKLMITVSNGRFLGGAFKIAPQASAVDGNLDACFISDSNVFQRLGLFIGAMRGRHLSMTGVTTSLIQQLTLNFAAKPMMEVDGELRLADAKTVDVRCVPRALAVIAAPGALA